MARFPAVPLPAWPTGGVSREVLAAEIGAWIGSPAFVELVSAFDGKAPDGELVDQLAYLEEFSVVWDRRAGAERFAARYSDYDEHTVTVVHDAAAALGLSDHDHPLAPAYDHVLILGGGRVTGRARARYAAELLSEGVSAGSVVGLGSLRVLPSAASAADPGSEAEQTEGDAMFNALCEAFPPDGPVDERSGITADGNAWWVRSYTCTGRPVHVLAAPPTRPGQRANTADTLLGWVEFIGRPSSTDSLLVVTTDLYVPFQHSDAIRILGLELRCGVETVGFSTRTFPHWPNGPAKTGELLQETRSAIFSLHRLLTAAQSADA